MFAIRHFRAALFLSLFLPAFTHVHLCSQSFWQEARNRNITAHCMKKSLGAEFGWNYFNDTRKLEILFGAKLDGDIGWLAWGLNPGKEPKMTGTRALIGIKQDTTSVKQDTTLMYDKYNITDYTKLGCQLFPSEIDLEVLNFSFSYVKQINMFIIHATIVLPKEYNDSRTNLVWQVGNAAAGKQPMMHPTDLQHFDSKATIDLKSGNLLTVGAHDLHKLRTVHGILNIVGWGILLPFGAIIARFFKRFPIECPRWFSLHISCQILGYILGSIGWIIGILLGNASKYYTFRIHRILGIIIFTFATLQMLALRLKPTKHDEYRVYWNMYHHFMGYSLLAIISVNIFHGIAIFSTDHTWKWVYIGILGVFGFIALSLEIFTWIKFCIAKNGSNQAVSQSSSTHDSTSGARKVHQQRVTEGTGVSDCSDSQSSSKPRPSFAKGTSGLKDHSAPKAKS